MVRTTKDKVIIEFKHPCPKNVIYDIKCAIIFVLQHQSSESLESEEEKKSSYYFMLLLLHEMMYEEKSPRKIKR